MAYCGIDMEGMAEDFTALRVMTDETRSVATHLRNALAPIENGAWTGEGATAFTQRMRDLIYRTNAMANSMATLAQAMSNADSKWVETVEVLNGIVAS